MEAESLSRLWENTNMHIVTMMEMEVGQLRASIIRSWFTSEGADVQLVVDELHLLLVMTSPLGEAVSRPLFKDRPLFAQVMHVVNVTDQRVRLGRTLAAAVPPFAYVTPVLLQ